MPASEISKVITAVVTLLVVASVAVGGVSGAVVTGSETPHPAVSGEEFRDVTPRIEAWERGALPLRVNSDSAATSVENTNGFVNVEALGTGDVPIDRERQTVYGAGSTLDLDFESKLGADTGDFANQETQLLVARIDEDAEAAESLIDGSPTMMTNRALSLLTGPNANENASFELVSAGTTDASGEVTTQYDLGTDGRGPGLYVFLLVQDYNSSSGTWGVTDDGFEVSAGELSMESRGRVLGADRALVQETSASVTPEQSTYTAGDDLTFDVDARQTTDAGSVTHALVVYDRATYENALVRTEISGEASGPISPSQVTVRRQIGAVNGVSNVERTTLFDTVSLDNGRVARIGSGVATVDFVTEQLGSDDPLDATTETPTTLDGSATVVQGGDTETMTVGTHANWSTGTYRYLYVASGSDTSEITTTTGTLSIEQPMTASAMIEGNTGMVTMPPGGAIISVDFQFPSGTTVDDQVTVTERPTPPPSLSSIPTGGSPIYADFDVPPDVEDERVNLRVVVNKSALNGRDPGSLSLWRYADGGWTELRTSVQSETTNTVTYTMMTDGFSSFALGPSTSPSRDSGGNSADGDSSSAIVNVQQTTLTPTPVPTETEVATETPTEAPTSSPTATETTTETAQPAVTTTETPTETTTQFPGFGAVITLVALILVITMFARVRAR